ncbi:MAG: family 78 glycoside hydrolase catalytic domain, partial [Bacteroidetes bacterium]|nr:family 78 glycoside hydrolase catalytic domain [Bacteroidota bacterium]
MNTIMKYIRFAILFVLIILFHSCTSEKISFNAIDLKCEYLSAPMGVESLNPRLYWILNSERRGAKQSAYQILAATSHELLNEKYADLWNSEKVNLDQSIHVKYVGKPLETAQTIYWKVRVWDEKDNVSPWSDVAKWDMAFLQESNWKAKWIGSSISKSGNEWDLPSPYFRKETLIQKEIKKARAYISGLGYYELYINGQKVGDHVLSPNQTNYDRRDVEKWDESRIGNMNTTVLYEVFDVTEFLQKGVNAFGVILGNGWYIQADRPLDKGLWYDTPRLIAQFEIEYKDGSKEIISSDESWKSAKSPIVYNGLHSGEIYDARLEQEGWNKPEFEDSNWENAVQVRAPTGKLKAQIAPPDRVTKTINPISVTEPEEGIYLFDMGQMFSGWARLTISGKKGSEIKLRF